jgi:hypothetical protein
MGGSNWSNDHQADRARVRAATNTPVFKHHDDVRTGKVANALHAALDPSKLKNGVREARDSAAHPNSVPVIFGLDVTGSMAHVPAIVQSNLGKLMTTLLTKGILADPQICFCAIGDSDTDRVPLQVGQFESGIEMEDDITKIYLEGNGGGTGEEGYEMAFYFATKHVATDAWDKRQKRGYLFLTGDERPYEEATPHAIHRCFGGERPAKGIPLSTLVKDAQEKFHVFFIIPSGTSHGSDPALYNYWTKLLGKDAVLRIEDASTICDLVSNTIGTVEGTLTALSTMGGKADPKPAAVDPSKAAVDAAKKSGSPTARL